jgi:hypothetical protein
MKMTEIEITAAITLLSTILAIMLNSALKKSKGGVKA